MRKKVTVQDKIMEIQAFLNHVHEDVQKVLSSAAFIDPAVRGLIETVGVRAEEFKNVLGVSRGRRKRVRHVHGPDAEADR